MRSLNPAQVLVIGFASVILVGAGLLMLPFATVQGGLPFLDALFTATSAVCVTGLVVVDTATTFTVFGQVVIVSLIQVGGLGFMTLATLIFMMLGRKIGFRNRLLIQESFNQSSVQGVVRLVRTVAMYTFVIEAGAAIILGVRFAKDFGWLRGMYFGVFHAVSAFCNAGFDLIGNFASLTPYRGDWVISITIMGLLIIGGLGFRVLEDLVHNLRKLHCLTLHSKLVLILTGLFLLTGAVAIFALEFNNPKTLAGIPWDEKILSSAFAAATPRTAGFNTLPTDGLRSSTLFLTIILMFIGASPASTGGGIKTTTLGVVLVAVYSMVRGESDAVLYKRRLSQTTIHKALAIIIIGITLVVTVTMILSVTEPFDFLAIMFEVVSAFGTVGLSTGITPMLSGLGKVLIILTMFAGRVGTVTLTLALSQRLKSYNIRYPEDRVIVG